jgi:hypothetical protein
MFVIQDAVLGNTERLSQFKDILREMKCLGVGMEVKLVIVVAFQRDGFEPVVNAYLTEAFVKERFDLYKALAPEDKARLQPRSLEGNVMVLGLIPNGTMYREVITLY